MNKEFIRQIIIDQQVFLDKKSDIISRDINISPYIKGGEIIVITGIRRCGKSTMLKLLAKKMKQKSVYINFDDIRFIDFQVEDFIKIEEVILELFETDSICLLLDEIQNLQHWARWVNNLYESKYQIFVTGSNAHLLSGEISTYLTGRNKQMNLHPFSFSEYLRIKSVAFEVKNLTTHKRAQMLNIWKDYFNIGGFPNIIKHNDIELSSQYFEDIIYKDIIHRYKIREIKEFKDMILFLFSNIGKIYSYASLSKISGIKSLSTIKNYLGYMENSFLIFQLSRFDYSLSKQKLSSHKIYASDNSFLKTVAFNFSENMGRRIENIVLIHLKRMYKEVYYHKNKGECDFIIKEGNNVTQAIQVTQFFEDKKQPHYERELAGLLEAMDQFNIDKGFILTESNRDQFYINGKCIQIMPVWEWMI